MLVSLAKKKLVGVVLPFKLTKNSVSRQKTGKVEY
jgi:hypothetical protein